jgi:hypothetical protein
MPHATLLEMSFFRQDDNTERRQMLTLAGA